MKPFVRTQLLVKSFSVTSSDYSTTTNSMWYFHRWKSLSNRWLTQHGLHNESWWKTSTRYLCAVCNHPLRRRMHLVSLSPAVRDQEHFKLNLTRADFAAICAFKIFTLLFTKYFRLFCTYWCDLIRFLWISIHTIIRFHFSFLIGCSIYANFDSQRY